MAVETQIVTFATTPCFEFLCITKRVIASLHATWDHCLQVVHSTMRSPISGILHVP